MMTMTDPQAADAIRGHHDELAAGLRRRVAEVGAAVRDKGALGASGTDVLAYLDTEIIPHARAEDDALYPAGDTGRSALLVRAMRDEHINLIAHVEALRDTTNPVDVACAAAAILALFESHLHKENELLIPVLVEDPTVSLRTLLAGMHELLG